MEVTGNYTIKGLACICRNGVDSIASALKELENHGYLTRQRVRFDNGRLGAIEYTIHEKPVSQETAAVSPEQDRQSQDRKNHALHE